MEQRAGTRHAQAAREYFQAGDRNGRQQAIHADYRASDYRWCRAAQRYSRPGPAFSRQLARTIPVGGQGQDRQDRPNRWHREPTEEKSAGFPAWSEDDVAAYERRWSIGTKERVWLDVLLYTGLRRGDAVVIGRQHVRDGIATLRTEKSQRKITVTLPILPVLQRTLDAGPIGELAFICGEKGKPLTKESFGNLFKKACKQAGLPNRSAHGCRKIAATRAAENGATVAQLEAIFGWKGGRMASSPENLCPHLMGRWERQSEKYNEDNGNFFEWWGR